MNIWYYRKTQVEHLEVLWHDSDILYQCYSLVADILEKLFLCR